MTVLQQMRDEGFQPSPFRQLAVRFRNGEALSREQLKALRDYAVANGNALLAERCREELRTEEVA
jgi:hypothetical protein